MTRILYISYDGALDPLGRSQVVPLLEGLSHRGHRFHLLSYEKPHRLRHSVEFSEMRARLAGAKVKWVHRRYHKRVPAIATCYDLAQGLREAIALHRAEGFEVVHARSYPSALIAWQLRHGNGIPYVFDIRGLYAEERVDSGAWRAGGGAYRMVKSLESRFFRDAATVVTLTTASVPLLTERLTEVGSSASLVVIPTTVDLDRFHPPEGRSEGLELAYIGSTGSWYMLDKMLQFARVFLLEFPSASLRFVINGDPEPVRAQAVAAGIPAERLSVTTCRHEEVPTALRRASATFFFITPLPSKLGSAATKLNESLALGLPAVVNRGVGDTADIVEQHKVGVAVEAFDEHAYRAAAWALRALLDDPGVKERCRRVASQLFSLDTACDRYSIIYAQARDAPAPSS